MFADIPVFLQPRLRLFLSVDLVGSTSFKQSSSTFPLQAPGEEATLSDLGAKWLSQIASFYRDVELHLLRSWEECRRIYKKETRSGFEITPVLWKVNGDELIYTVDIDRADQIFYCLAAWIGGIKTYRVSLRQETPRDNRLLDVKSSAWTAGFPLGNAEVIFYSNVERRVDDLGTVDPKARHFQLLEKWYEDTEQRVGLVKDYVGPSLDTGFRLAAFSTPRKLVISAEIALILSSVSKNDAFCKAFNLTNGLPIGYDGKHAMKGVIGEKPYPVFWIDTLTEDEFTLAEDKLSPPVKPEDKDIKTYCQAFFTENNRYLLRPFIHTCTDSNFSIPPEHYATNLSKLSNVWKLEKDRLEKRLKSISDETAPSEKPGYVQNVPQTILDNLVADLQITKEAGET